MGYSAGYYEPIARAIDGINKQMNINAQRSNDREALGLQRLLTASKLRTQEETNALNKHISERADQRLEDTLKNSALNRKHSISGEKRAVDLAARQEKLMVLKESQIKEETEKLNHQHNPNTPVNMFNYFNRNERMVGVLGNPIIKQQIESNYGGSGNVTFDVATGFIMNNKTGQPLKMSRYKNNNHYRPAIEGIVAGALDPQAVIRGDITQLKNEKALIKEKLKAGKINTKGVDAHIAQSAKYKQQIANLNARIKEKENLSIDDKLEMYDQQEQRIIDRYMKAKKSGLSLANEKYFELTFNRIGKLKERLHREKLKQMTNANALAKKAAGGKPAVTLKDLRISYEKIRDIGYNAIKQLNPMIPEFNKEKERIEKAAFEQKLIIAKQYFARGGNLSDLGLTKEQVFPEEKEVKLVPNKKDLKPKTPTKKYKTKEDVKNAYKRKEISQEEAVDLVRNL